LLVDDAYEAVGAIDVDVHRDGVGFARSISIRNGAINL